MTAYWRRLLADKDAFSGIWCDGTLLTCYLDVHAS